MAGYFERFHRGSLRLQGYDYARAGAYFVTIVAHQRRMFFGKIIGGEMNLSNVGEIAARCWNGIPDHFPSVVLDEFVVMPDHMHGIIVIKRDLEWAAAAQHAEQLLRHPFHPPQRPRRNAYQHIIPKSLGSIIRQFKGAVTRECGIRGIAFRWQRNFHERIIRDDRHLTNVRRYIRNNPMRWSEENE